MWYALRFAHIHGGATFVAIPVAVYACLPVRSRVLVRFATLLFGLEGVKCSCMQITSVLSLLLGLVAQDPVGYEEAVPKIIKLLTRYNVAKECDKDYTYYKTPSPWIQCKLLRLLQYFPPPKEKALLERLNDVLTRILTKTEVTKSVNKNNADHGILFEAVNLIIHMSNSGYACR